MIPTTHQLAPVPKRLERRLLHDQHVDGIKQVYGRVDLMPADYLTVHADSDVDRVAKIRAMAVQRRAIRNAKRLANHKKSS